MISFFRGSFFTRFNKSLAVHISVLYSSKQNSLFVKIVKKNFSKQAIHKNYFLIQFYFVVLEDTGKIFIHNLRLCSQYFFKVLKKYLNRKRSNRI